MTGVTNKSTDIASIHEQIEQLDHDIQRVLNKLNNDGYMAKAPAAIVEKERKKLASYEQEQNKLKKQINAFESQP